MFLNSVVLIKIYICIFCVSRINWTIWLSTPGGLFGTRHGKKKSEEIAAATTAIMMIKAVNETKINKLIH